VADMKTVGEVSELAGVTVRTLHHYDEIGLLSPSGRSDAGYRLYSYSDLVRLQEILGWRTLGFSLAEIQALLDDPGYDRVGALRNQRTLVDTEIERLGALARALDAALAAERNGARLKEAHMFEGFDHSQYEEEVRERWGHTAAYRESARRAASYGEEDWRAIRTESQEIVSAFASLMQDGEPADGEAARALAERHRNQISDRFYECSQQLHRGLAQMYIADPRFTRTYEQVAPGLARYVHDAIVANANANADADANGAGAGASAPMP
jgi:MerR family transcriptional regulator, thiopeptide resistance regulator